MSLFRKKYDYRQDFLPAGDAKFRHLERLADLTKVTVREPVMRGNGTSVVFLPLPDFDEPDYQTKNLVTPDRLSDDTRDFGPWLTTAEGVRYFGKSPVTLLFDNPDDGFVPSEHHPVNLICDAAYRAFNAKALIETPFGTSESDDWATLLKGKQGSPPVYGCLSRPGPISFAYALVYISGADNHGSTGSPLGGAMGDKPVVFAMTRNTAQALFEVLDEVPGNFTGTKVVHFYDRKAGTCPAKVAADSQVAAAGLGQRRAPIQAAAAAQQLMAGYAAYVSDTVTGLPGAPMNRRAMVEHACKTLMPWEEVLKGSTPKQCADIIANQCGLPASLLYHAWKSMPEYYSDEMKFKLKNPRSVTPQPEAGRRPASNFTDTVAQSADGFGIPPGATSNTDTEYKLGDAPWGGNIADAPAADDVPYDEDAAVKEAQARFEAAQRARAGGATAARATAQQPRR